MYNWIISDGSQRSDGSCPDIACMMLVAGIVVAAWTSPYLHINSNASLPNEEIIDFQASPPAFCRNCYRIRADTLAGFRKQPHA
eukprot:scaffold89391_cov16-Prasinocladus_malaysianus.AAC.1